MSQKTATKSAASRQDPKPSSEPLSKNMPPPQKEAMRSRKAGPKQSLVPPQHCSLALTFEKLGERWTLLIIRSSLYGLNKFEEFQSELGIPRTVLSQRLRMLCDTGIFEQRPYQVPGKRQRMGYHLTPIGEQLLVPFMGLTQWSDIWHNVGKKRAVCFKSRKTGEPLHFAMVDETGQEVARADILAQLCGELREQQQDD